MIALLWLRRKELIALMHEVLCKFCEPSNLSRCFSREIPLPETLISRVVIIRMKTCLKPLRSQFWSMIAWMTLEKKIY